jgi:hypothetical protein
MRALLWRREPGPSPGRSPSSVSADRSRYTAWSGIEWLDRVRQGEVGRLVRAIHDERVRPRRAPDHDERATRFATCLVAGWSPAHVRREAAGGS